MKRANIIVMTLTGIFLLITSVMKIHQLLTEPILSKGFWESWEFFVIQIPLEIGLGIWLCSGLFRKAGWLLGLIGFGAFIIVMGYKVATGAESCPCFGKLEVSPWITLFAIDIPIFLLLAVFRPRDCKLLPPPWPSGKHFFCVATPTAIILSVIIPGISSKQSPAYQRDLG